ncbi:sensor histidine kinase [Actinoplanes sp. NPDC049681]|uniref:sensor histidine kinase n=1 Tax=Actinoplanes sp. NPDC049681 TaxID=3363905 RepID=UPI003795E69C
MTFLAARIDHWAQEHPLRLDTSLAGATWLLCGLPSALVAGRTGLAVGTAAIAALAVRRRHPAAVLAWSIGAFAVQLVVVPIPLPANAAQAVVVYTVAAHVASLPVRLTALAAAIIGCVAGGFRWSTPPQYTRNALLIGTVLAVVSGLLWAVGSLVRGRAANMRALGELLAQRERVSAAAEIHDIVAHSLTVVIVQADGGRYAAEHAETWDRKEAENVLTTIADTARTALAEVRGLIRMLHEPADDPAGADLAALRRLLGSVRASGLPVAVTAEPTWFDEVPAVVRLAALRIVREALTNVLKHAGPGATATVTMQREQGTVRLRVEDDGGSATDVPPGAGHGIDGMRHRVRALGGTLTAGPRTGSGFAVEATLPAAR